MPIPKMNPIARLVEDATPPAVALRHELHAHPELGFQEHDTARRIHDRLLQIPNLRVQTGVAGTGIVALLNADRDGPCVALRAELDALPITEETNAAYASKSLGRMHACGHDGHMACLVGAAMVLSKIADTLPGRVKFVFQPAEEGGGGAKVMIDAGALNDPMVDAAFALHGWPDLDLGTIAVSAGPVMASADFFTITIRGRGTHAAYPHRGVDPIVVASHVVVALQTIASRTVDPLKSVVVTVGTLHAGTANNIIPETAIMEGTIRTLDPAVRTSVLARFQTLVAQTAAAHGATAEIEMGNGYTVLLNDPRAAALVRSAATTVDRADRCVESGPSMGGEDFAFIAERVPAAFWRLGVRQGDPASQPTLHQSTYNFPDAAIPLGIRMHCEIARRFLQARMEHPDAGPDTRRGENK